MEFCSECSSSTPNGPRYFFLFRLKKVYFNLVGALLFVWMLVSSPADCTYWMEYPSTSLEKDFPGLSYISCVWRVEDKNSPKKVNTFWDNCHDNKNQIKIFLKQNHQFSGFKKDDNSWGHRFHHGCKFWKESQVNFLCGKNKNIYLENQSMWEIPELLRYTRREFWLLFVSIFRV